MVSTAGSWTSLRLPWARKIMAIFLDTSDSELYQYAPIQLEHASIVIACSATKSEGLGDSKYNERRSRMRDRIWQRLQKVNGYYRAWATLTE